MLLAVHDPVVSYRLNGRVLAVPLSHDLPILRRALPTYSENLRRLAGFVRERSGTLYLVDVGANVGDSWALAGPGAGGTFLLVEGSLRYFGFLERNTRNDPSVTRVLALLAERDEEVEAAILAEHGTGEPRLGGPGAERTRTRTLDRLFEERPALRATNLLKVDVDGWDPLVLRGGRRLIAAARPAILFEHSLPHLPPGEDEGAVFRDLAQMGYGRWLFYDNRGFLIGEVGADDDPWLRNLLRYARQQRGYYYDVCCFHDSQAEARRAFLEREIASCPAAAR
jgi:FkbM family methyltransferase